MTVLENRPGTRHEAPQEARQEARDEVRVETGEAARARLSRLSGWIDERSTAFCTSADWLRAAARHLPGVPVMITVGPADPPRALAPLVVTTRRGVRRVQLLGGDQNDYGPIFHDDTSAAEQLADAVAGWLATHRSWTVRFDQLSPADPFLRAVADRLPESNLEPGPPMPHITGLDAGYQLGRSRRRGVAKALRRVERDGRTWRQVEARDLDEVARWLPAIVALRRRRDHASGRRSHLDDPRIRSFYETVLLTAAAHGRAVLDLLIVDDDVAGYNVAMLDGPVHRLWDGRVADELQSYRGGLVCDVLAVRRALEAPGVTTFDWLRGRTDAKFGNAEATLVGLQATSGPLVAAIDTWAESLRRHARSAVPDALVRTLVAR